MDKIQNALSFSDVLRYQAKIRPTKIFLYNAHGPKRYSFKDIDELTDRACTYLLSNGVGRSDIISVVLDNSCEYIVLFFAALRLGCVFNPFPINLSVQDVEKYLSYVDPQLVFCREKHYEGLKSLRWPVQLIASRKDNEGFFKDLPVNKGEMKDFVPQVQDAACIYYSSGTTDNPKGIVFSHANMMSNIASIVRAFGWTEDDCHLIVLPLGHTASLNYSFLPCMYAGASLVLADSFWKIRDIFWQLMAQFAVTYVEVVPSVLFSILNTHYNDYSRQAIGRFKYIGCGSAPLPVEIQVKIEEQFLVRVVNLYGLSETGPSHFDDPNRPSWKPGTIGKPLDCNEVKILDDQGHELGPKAIGEIAIKGPNVFIDYYKNNKAYQRVFADGFFLTGDLGFVDEEGIHYFTERKKDLIIKGGVNIFPGEIDEIIFKHPSVKESLTVGQPDAYLGERIQSFVVLKEGQNVGPQAIKDFCFEKLGEFKCPDEVIFIDDIPKGPSGKLLRRSLRQTARSMNSA